VSGSLPGLAGDEGGAIGTAERPSRDSVGEPAGSSGRRGGQHVLIVPDGGADRYRGNQGSPLAAASIETIDRLADEGVCGRMSTLYGDLPRESLVAHLGLLGWEPHRHYPHGRASCELLALEGVELGDDDLAFRANLVHMQGDVLRSYNADLVPSRTAQPLIERVNDRLRREFPSFELYHNSDFRNTLVVRGAGIAAEELVCPEPHEHQGEPFDLACLVCAATAAAGHFAERLNRYLALVRELLDGEPANALFPWSASRALCLPPFGDSAEIAAGSMVVGAMDFLHGLARAGGMGWIHVGTGRPVTDYAGKGQATVACLEEGYRFVLCHVNAPDEASHMGDLDAKVASLEQIDRHVVAPVVEHFERHPEALGSVAVVPDHYTNLQAAWNELARCDAHSIEPVPFLLWDGGRTRDRVRCFDEDSAVGGRYGRHPVSHLDLLPLMGVATGVAAGDRAVAEDER